MAEQATAAVQVPNRQSGAMVAGLRIALFLVAVAVQFGLCLRVVIVHHNEYRPAWLATASLAVFAAATLGSGWWVLRRKPLPTPFVAVAVPALFLASVAVTVALPAGQFFGELHWSFGLIGWPLLLLLMDRPFVVIVEALGLHVVLSLIQAVLVGLPGRAELGSGMIVLVSVISYQLASAVFVRLIHRHALLADQVAAAQEQLATAKAVAEELSRGRLSRFADQLGSTLPLLAGLADRTLDTRTGEVRRRCALAAAQLHRLFAENDDVPDPLVHELSACIDVAERRGLAVSLAVSGTAIPIPKTIRRELTQPVMAALALARSTARVTVLRRTDTIRVALVADACHPGPQPSLSPSVDVVVSVLDQQLWLEARWSPQRQPIPAM